MSSQYYTDIQTIDKDIMVIINGFLIFIMENNQIIKKESTRELCKHY